MHTELFLKLSLNALYKWAEFWDLSIPSISVCFVQIGYVDELRSYVLNIVWIILLELGGLARRANYMPSAEGARL